MPNDLSGNIAEVVSLVDFVSSLSLKLMVCNTFMYVKRILNIFWPNIITNEELHKQTSTQSLVSEIKCRRWRWISHVIRMPQTALPRMALRWSPPGKRKRGRPKETWRRTVEKEIREGSLSWGLLKKLAKDEQQWRSLVTALCAS
ncbi:uncharacterized protein LOC121389156 [Gigantopelta aegis]|uniref:uncharacterized protein LOC121389156 n=1 Tax=Gigantopelta aegis TaxID=1735272 RepID=UPI001B889F11|nr:uncharacterized protein LOC121389156 [Gigantopelta aegis]